MAQNLLSISKILQSLLDENLAIDQAPILTYIQSNIEKENSSPTIHEVQYVELCKFLLSLMSVPDINQLTVDTRRMCISVKLTLHGVLRSFDHRSNFLKMISHIDRKERSWIMKFLNSIEIDIFIQMMQNSKSVDVIDDCFQKVSANEMRWLAANACMDNIQLLTEAETRIMSDEQYNEEQLVLHTLTVLYRLYEYASTHSTDFNIEPFHPLLFDRVIPLAYMGHKRQRMPALNVVNQALNTNLISYIKEKNLSVWLQYKNTLQDTYCTRMSLLVKAAEHDWSNQWSMSIRILGIELHRGAELINNLLSVEEKAFKSADMTVRKEAFESWKELIDNFALDATELATSRRIKLLCIPLNAKNSKIEIVAISKLETWWHLIVKLYLNADKSLNQVIGQFLNFCFGPLGDTPLLSKKCDVVASPGKRFFSTKLLAIDALFQLLIQKPNDRRLIPFLIKERLPNAVPSTVIQANYKSIFHSAGEALLVTNELNNNELKDRKKLNEILWLNLIISIEQSPDELKNEMYNELIMILVEVLSHIADSSLIIDLLNMTVSHLVNAMEHLIYHDNTLINFILKLLSSKILKKSDETCLKNLIRLINHAIKPENVKEYHSNTLTFTRLALKEMELITEQDVDFYIVELWSAIAEIIIKYMKKNQPIYEGTILNCNLEAMKLLILFPMEKIFWWDSKAMLKVSKLWRDLYKQFDMKAELITIWKTKKVFHIVTTMIEKSFMKDKRCHRIIAHCFDILIKSINCNVFVKENEIPPLIRLLRDVTIAAVIENNESEIELSLRAMSSLLTIVNDFNPKSAMMYLNVLKPSIERILELKYSIIVEKEIIKTWETVVIILRGLKKLLTQEFILSYRKSILLALRHDNCEIARHTISLINIKSALNEEVKILFEQIEKMAQKTPASKVKLAIKTDEDLTKRVKIVGSFLNRRISSPKTVVAAKKNNEIKKITVPSPPPPTEPDSQDYVVIENNVILDINRLTEHQKESFKRHRDDIPALYNDLSQSASHNTQDFEGWFKNKLAVASEEKNLNAITDDNIRMDDETNKENNDDECVKEIENNNKKLNEDNLDITNDINLMKSKNGIPINDINTQIKVPADNENTSINEEIELEINSNRASEKINDEINFESHEEYPDENISVDSLVQCSSQLSEEKIHKQPEEGIDSYIDTASSSSSSSLSLSSSSSSSSLSLSGHDTSNIEVESQSQRSSLLRKPGRPRGKTTRVGEKSVRCTRLSNNSNDYLNKNYKRKTPCDNESVEYPDKKKQRLNSMSNSSLLDNTESIIPLQSENHAATLSNENLPKRTKKEMERLQINMVFNGRTPSKLRSKTADDYIYGSNNKRQKSIKHSDKIISENDTSQELVKKRRYKETRISSEVKAQSLKTVQVQSLKKDENVSRNETEIELEINDEEKLLDTVKSTEVVEVNEKSDVNENKEAIVVTNNNPEISNENNISKILPTVNNNRDTQHIEDDEEEVIESSQKSNSLLRSPCRKNLEERINAMNPLTKISPQKEIVHEKCSETSLNVSIITQQVDNIGELLHEDSNNVSSITSNFQSPKSIVRPRTKVFTSQGRAAHMLGLVTKLAIGDKNGLNDNIKYSDEEMSKKLKFSREFENDIVTGRKERTSTLKEPDRIGSPSGSRQEKIFNNMKAKDYTLSPPTNLFKNLKNDGEKISPKYEKVMSTQSMKANDKDNNDDNGNGTGNGNISFEKEILPILEWSNANPPSLTASPSTSILKRQRQIVLEIDNDTIPNKKKRVSFADPPVSREMGYEVMAKQSPIKTNKSGQSRSLLGRKDTPIKMKQMKFRTIQLDMEKSNQSSIGKSNESTSTNIIEIGHQENELLTKDVDDVEDDTTKTDIPNFCHNEMNTTLCENFYMENLPNASTPDTAQNPETMNIQDVDENHIDERQTDSSIIEERNISKTHNDDENISYKDKNYDENGLSKMIKSEELFVSDDRDLSNINITDDSTIARILNNSGDGCKSSNLEDTVDIENISNLNSSENSDDLFPGKLIRTSTEISADNAIAESDTLPVTESMFLSQTESQGSIGTQQNLTPPLPHIMDVTQPICPTLLGCSDSIDTILHDLVNPLWEKNLSKYLILRGVNTIGDFAQLSEREVARFPVKGSPKVDYIKQVLNKVSLSRFPSLEDKIIEKQSERIATSDDILCVKKEDTEIEDEMSELIVENNYNNNNSDGDNNNHNMNDDNPNNDNNIATNITEISSVADQLPSDKDIIEAKIEVVKEDLENDVTDTDTHDYGSTIIDTTISPVSKNSVTTSQTPGTPMAEASTIGVSIKQLIPTSKIKYVGVKMKIENVLDEIDPNILLQKAIQLNCPENIIAQYKIKMKHKSEAEFLKDSLKMLGLETSTDIGFKNACHDYGLNKVLGRLPAIFNAENKFFTKVLKTYRMKITADDCIEGLDLNQMKKAICKKCSSSEICEMLSTVLMNEEKEGNKTPITEVSSLNAMLKRMPMDSIISHTVANDELIPSSFVLEIALQNNNSDVISHALDAQFPDIVENIMNRNMSSDAITSYINKCDLTNNKLLDIYRAVCDKLSPEEILDAHNEIMKKKLSFLGVNPAQ